MTETEAKKADDILDKLNNIGWLKKKRGNKPMFDPIPSTNDLMEHTSYEDWGTTQHIIKKLREEGLIDRKYLTLTYEGKQIIKNGGYYKKWLDTQKNDEDELNRKKLEFQKLVLEIGTLEENKKYNKLTRWLSISAIIIAGITFLIDLIFKIFANGNQ